mgnify:CR=1 FL=1
MHATKGLLITRHGLKCMLCGRTIEYKDIQWHHIKPKYASKADGEPVDDSYENGSLTCVECHRYIHLHSWWSDEYQRLLQTLKNKISAVINQDMNE